MLQRARKTTGKYNSDYGTRTSEKKRQQKRKKYLALYIGFVILVGCFMVVYISQSIKINNMSYRIEDLEEEYSGIQEENERMEIELSSSNSLSRIEKVARNELDMGKPEQIAYIDLDEGKRDIQNSTPEEGKDTFFGFRVFDEVASRFNTVRAFGK
ncbi:MAG: cell division protein FtsL [Halanaerobiaceae bacterium]